MKALFITSIREGDRIGTIEAMDIPIPEPADDEIRVKPTYVSICGSDAHILSGDMGPMTEGMMAMLPFRLGHEMSGIIDKVGEKAQSLFKEGDRVVCNYTKYCYSCEACHSGQLNFCQNAEIRTDCMAEYVIYHMTQVHKIPDTLDLLKAVLVEPLTIAIDAVEKCQVGIGKSVAIMGAGGIGLMIANLAKLTGAYHVTVFDQIPEKCEFALKYGADAAFTATDTNTLNEAKALVSGGYDCVFEGTGNEGVAQITLDLMKPGGHAVYYAMYGNVILKADLFKDFYWDEKHLHGLKMGSGLFPKSINMATCMDLLPLIGKVHPFFNYEEAFKDQLSKKYPKIVMEMPK